MDGPFRSERHFQVWTYTVSHRRLLLRSVKEGSLATRIDLYFGGVTRMLLRPAYDGLHAAEADQLDLDLYRERYGDLGPELKVFTLEPDLASFVVAGVMQWHEDAGGFEDPSHFGHFPGAP
ncbi:MAG TPA: hypothetical protein VK453_22045 [Micromonosporaceae bacterium]|nr:hypothetical protein [Micromonosporaceae bacterium]